MLTTAVVGYDIAHTPKVNAQENTPMASPTPFIGTSNIKLGEVVISTPTPKPLTVEEKIEATFGEDTEMLHIAFCESSYNLGAKHTISSAKGLFQIINGTWNHYKCTGDPLDADDNIKCAKRIYDKEGTRPWVASYKCWK